MLEASVSSLVKWLELSCSSCRRFEFSIFSTSTCLSSWSYDAAAMLEDARVTCRPVGNVSPVNSSYWYKTSQKNPILDHREPALLKLYSPTRLCVSCDVNPELKPLSHDLLAVNPEQNIPARQPRSATCTEYCQWFNWRPWAQTVDTQWFSTLTCPDWTGFRLKQTGFLH